MPARDIIYEYHRARPAAQPTRVTARIKFYRVDYRGDFARA